MHPLALPEPQLFHPLVLPEPPLDACGRLVPDGPNFPDDVAAPDGLELQEAQLDPLKARPASEPPDDALDDQCPRDLSEVCHLADIRPVAPLDGYGRGVPGNGEAVRLQRAEEDADLVRNDHGGEKRSF